MHELCSEKGLPAECNLSQPSHGPQMHLHESTGPGDRYLQRPNKLSKRSCFIQIPFEAYLLWLTFSKKSMHKGCSSKTQSHSSKLEAVSIPSQKHFQYSICA